MDGVKEVVLHALNHWASFTRQHGFFIHSRAAESEGSLREKEATIIFI